LALARMFGRLNNRRPVILPSPMERPVRVELIGCSGAATRSPPAGCRAYPLLWIAMF
jgi:hypothetical protein